MVATQKRVIKQKRHSLVLFYGGRTLKVPVNLAFVQRRGIGHPLFWILKPHTKKYK
jgi:hypothetical protein